MLSTDDPDTRFLSLPTWTASFSGCGLSIYIVLDSWRAETGLFSHSWDNLPFMQAPPILTQPSFAEFGDGLVQCNVQKLLKGIKESLCENPSKGTMEVVLGAREALPPRKRPEEGMLSCIQMRLGRQGLCCVST